MKRIHEFHGGRKKGGESKSFKQAWEPCLLRSTKKKMVTERKISVLVSEARIANLETLTRENLFKVNLFSS